MSSDLRLVRDEKDFGREVEKELKERLSWVRPVKVVISSEILPLILNVERSRLVTRFSELHLIPFQLQCGGSFHPLSIPSGSTRPDLSDSNAAISSLPAPLIKLEKNRILRAIKIRSFVMVIFEVYIVGLESAQLLSVSLSLSSSVS
jgi:hypothetical protein